MGLFNILGMALLLALAIGLVAIEMGYIKDNYTPNVKSLKINDYNPFVSVPTIAASEEVIQFTPNLRFPSGSISYYINPNCDTKKSDRITMALGIIASEAKLINFYTASEQTAQILIGCSKESYQTEKNSFIAGEGGPTNFINSTLYPIILKGKVILYDEKPCDYPVTELHELLHVFGFDHINDSKMIMYPYVNCEQRINPEVISQLITLYSIPSLPELYFANATATKDRKYLNLSIQINNIGLAQAKKVGLEIYGDDVKVTTYDFGEIDYGAGTNFYAGNIALPSKNVQIIKLVIVSQEKELDEKNNVLEMKLE